MPGRWNNGRNHCVERDKPELAAGWLCEAVRDLSEQHANAQPTAASTQIDRTLANVICAERDEEIDVARGGHGKQGDIGREKGLDAPRQ